MANQAIRFELTYCFYLTPIHFNTVPDEIIDFTGYIQNIAGAKATIKGYYIDQSDWLAVWHQAGAIRMRMPPNGYYVGGPFVLIVTYLQ